VLTLRTEPFEFEVSAETVGERLVVLDHEQPDWL